MSDTYATCVECGEPHDIAESYQPAPGVWRCLACLERERAHLTDEFAAARLRRAMNRAIADLGLEVPR